MSLRALVEEHDEADIIIDASAPLIHSIVAWAETTGAGRHLLFKTENSEYYASVRSSLKARGWRGALTPVSFSTCEQTICRCSTGTRSSKAPSSPRSGVPYCARRRLRTSRVSLLTPRGDGSAYTRNGL